MAQGMDSDYSDWSFGGEEGQGARDGGRERGHRGGQGQEAHNFDDDDKMETDFSIDHVITFGAPGWIYKNNSLLLDNPDLKGLRVYNSVHYEKNFLVDPVTCWGYPSFWHPPGLEAVRIAKGGKPEHVTDYKLPDCCWDADLHRLNGSRGYYEALDSLSGLSCQDEGVICQAAGHSEKVNVETLKLLLHLSYNCTTGEHTDKFDTQYVFLDDQEVENTNYITPAIHGEEQDHSWLLGHGGACYLTFKGSDSSKSWNRDFDDEPSDFCTLGLVHGGYILQLQDMLKVANFNKTLIGWFFNSSVCKTRTVLGHSLGGAMAEMFSTCVQKKKGMNDFF